jgi:hypothetical protein
VRLCRCGWHPFVLLDQRIATIAELNWKLACMKERISIFQISFELAYTNLVAMVECKSGQILYAISSTVALKSDLFRLPWTDVKTEPWLYWKHGAYPNRNPPYRLRKKNNFYLETHHYLETHRIGSKQKVVQKCGYRLALGNL